MRAVGLATLPADEGDYLARFAAADATDPQTGPALLKAGRKPTAEALRRIKIAVAPSAHFLFTGFGDSRQGFGAALAARDTLERDGASGPAEAAGKIIKRLTPARARGARGKNRPPRGRFSGGRLRLFQSVAPGRAEGWLSGLLGDPRLYSLFSAGRKSLNERLRQGGSAESPPLDAMALTPRGVLEAPRALLRFSESGAPGDAPGRRGRLRVRAAGELLGGRLRDGLARAAKTAGRRAGGPAAAGLFIVIPAPEPDQPPRGAGPQEAH
jgi:hypothetical protein